uniref:Ubiquitin-like domain-containing protein n=1 Tax=Caenorhabditis tropicalis TaxID=1561998 RepID=A0A1I7TGL7_9PELO
MCENSILSEIEQLRVDGSGIPPNNVSNVTFEEMRKDQAKFNKEVLNSLQLIRQEMIENQKGMRVEMEKMKGEHEESEEKMEEKMFCLKYMMTEIQRTIQNEQMKVLSEVEAIRNDMKTMKKDFEVTKKNRTTSDHFSSQKIEFAISFEGRNGIFKYFPTDTILDLKKEIAIRTGIPVHQQKIYFNGKCENHKTLVECGVQNNSVGYMQQGSY